MTALKFAKSAADVKIEVDDLLEASTVQAKKILSGEQATVSSKELTGVVNSLGAISEIRLGFRGELTAKEEARLQLDREKLEHSKETDSKRINLEVEKHSLNKDRINSNEEKPGTSITEVKKRYGL